MERRTPLLAAAVLLAAVGTALVLLYARSADDRALADADPVEILVAEQQIDAGTTAADAAAVGALGPQRIPAGTVAPGALASLGGVGDLVALTTIYPGQQLLPQMFGQPADAGNALPLPKGTIAVAFSFDNPNRVAGFVRPGSTVAVFHTGAGRRNRTRLLLEDAQVLAVGPTTAGEALTARPDARDPEDVPRTLVTLALTQREAERMIYASSTGSLYLALLTDNSTVDGSSGGAGADNLFP